MNNTVEYEMQISQAGQANQFCVAELRRSDESRSDRPFEVEDTKSQPKPTSDTERPEMLRGQPRQHADVQSKRMEVLKKRKEAREARDRLQDDDNRCEEQLDKCDKKLHALCESLKSLTCTSESLPQDFSHIMTQHVEYVALRMERKEGKHAYEQRARKLRDVEIDLDDQEHQLSKLENWVEHTNGDLERNSGRTTPVSRTSNMTQDAKSNSTAGDYPAPRATGSLAELKNLESYIACLEIRKSELAYERFTEVLDPESLKMNENDEQSIAEELEGVNRRRVSLLENDPELREHASHYAAELTETRNPVEIPPREAHIRMESSRNVRILDPTETSQSRATFSDHVNEA